MTIDLAAQIAAAAIVHRDVDELIPYARNARTHSDAQVAMIAASIREFGFTAPVLTDGAGGILAGHGRVMAARKLGLKTVPTIDLAHLTPTQRKAYILADNQIALKAGWDDEMLAMELGELVNEDGLDANLLGFDDFDLAKLLGDDFPGKGAVDDAPAAETGAGAGTGTGEQGGAGSLAARFGVPPFTVLNARAGWWQDRKRAWLALGIRSELGRGAPPGGAPMPLDRAEGGKRHPGRVDDASD